MKKINELHVTKLVVDTAATGGGITSEAAANLLVSNALAENKMFVGNAGGVAAAKTAAEVLNLLMTSAGYYPVLAGASVAENDANASIVVSDAKINAGDIAFAIVIAATNAVYVQRAEVTEDTLTVTLSGNGGIGTQIAYLVLRATT